jgi:hypothetical protein
MLKQMLWDNNKMYKQSVEEYERKQKSLELLRLQQQQQYNSQFQQMHPMKISVAGEPVVQLDRRGNALVNKMKQIDENFEDIQNMVFTLNFNSYNLNKLSQFIYKNLIFSI